MESSHAVVTGELLKLSEQQLVDCAGSDWGNSGCNGGLESNAFQYYEQNYAILESDYAYTGTDDTCAYNSSPKTNVKATDYVEITPRAEA